MSLSITLTYLEDWEPWLAQLQAVANIEIWPYIDPDTLAPQEGLLEKPNRLEIRDFVQNAFIYAQLSALH